MRHWVKRQIVWTEEAQASVAVMQQVGFDLAAGNARAALQAYATTGQCPDNEVNYFDRGAWRGWWRLKESGVWNGWRVLFQDRPNRRLIVVKRVRLRPDAYNDPPA